MSNLCCSLSVVVEDVSSSCCVTVKVFPYMTVAALKQQVRIMINNEIMKSQSSSTDSWSSSSSGFSRVRIPSSRAALGYRSVFVHRAKVTRVLRGAEGRRHGVPLPDLCPTSPHHPPAVPAGPGERPPRPTPPPRQWTHLPRLEGLQHPALTATPQQPGSV